MNTTTYRDRVADYLKSRPNTWIDGMTLAQIGGTYAWRSRVSDARRDLGLQIENRQRVVKEHSRGCPAVQAWDVAGACSCGRPHRRTVSEYMLVQVDAEGQGRLAL